MIKRNMIKRNRIKTVLALAVIVLTGFASNASGKLVFWRGSSYLPYWQSDRVTYVPQVIARKGDGSDNQNF